MGIVDEDVARVRDTADIIQVIQALVLAFVAAPLLIRTIYHLRVDKSELERAPSLTWGR